MTGRTCLACAAPIGGMKVLDLFAGACGGWSLGLHRAGFETASKGAA